VAVGTCTGASEVVLVAPGADCSDMVDKDGINDHRECGTARMERGDT
jgi:hypothetical protein